MAVVFVIVAVIGCQPCLVFVYFVFVSRGRAKLRTGGVRVVPGDGVPGVPQDGAEAAERPILPGGGVLAGGRCAAPTGGGRPQGVPPQV